MSEELNRVVGQIQGTLVEIAKQQERHGEKLDAIQTEMAEHRGSAKRSTLIGSFMGAAVSYLATKFGVPHQ